MSRFIFILVVSLFTIPYVCAQDTIFVDSARIEKLNITLKIAQRQDRFGMMNDTGKVVLPFQYEQVRFVAPDSCLAWRGMVVIRQDNLCALADFAGKALTPLQYEEIGFLLPTCKALTTKGLVMRVKQAGKFGLLDAQGNLLIRPSYNKIEILGNEKGDIFSPEIVRVNKNGKYGFMNLQNNTVLPTNYEAIEFLAELKVKDKKQIVLKIKQKDKWGMKNLQYNDEIEFFYDDIQPHEPQTALALVKKNKKYGFVDARGSLKIEADYTWAESFRNGVAVAQKGKYGLLAPTGKWAVNPLYDELGFATPSRGVNLIYTQLLIAKKADKYGIIEVSGKEKWAFEYEKISYNAAQNRLELTKDGKIESIRLD